MAEEVETDPVLQKLNSKPPPQTEDDPVLQKLNGTLPAAAPILKKNESSDSGNGSQTPATPSTTSGTNDTPPKEPIPLPASYDRLNEGSYKNLTPGQDYIMDYKRGGNQVIKTWDGQKFIAKQTAIQPIIEATSSDTIPQGKVATTQDAIAKGVTDLESSQNEAADKANESKLLANYKPVQQLHALQQAKQSAPDQATVDKIQAQIDELKSQPLKPEDFAGVQTPTESIAAPKLNPTVQTLDVPKGAQLENQPLTEPAKLPLPEGIKTVGDAYNRLQQNADFINDVTEDTKQVDQIRKIEQFKQLTPEQQNTVKNLPPDQIENGLELASQDARTEKGFWASMSNGLQESIDAYHNFGKYYHMNPDDVEAEMKQAFMKEQLFGKHPEGLLANLGQGLGGVTPALAATASIPATGPAGIAAGATIMGADSYIKTKNEALKAYYFDKFQKGEKPDFNEAQRYSTTQAGMNAALMAGMGGLSAVGKGAELVSNSWKDAAANLVKSGLKASGRDAIVFGVGGKLLSDIVNEKYKVDNTDTYGQTTLNMAVFSMALHLLTHAPGTLRQSLGVKAKAQAEAVLAYLPENQVNAAIQDGVTKGTISPEYGNELQEKQNLIRAEIASIPHPIDIETANKLVPLFKERAALNEKRTHESTTPDIKRAIEARISEIDLKVLLETATPLSADEKEEYNKLTTSSAEGKPTDNARIKYLEKRMQAVKDAKEEAKAEKAADKESGKAGKVADKTGKVDEGVEKPTMLGGAKVYEHAEDTHTAEHLENGIKPTDLTPEGRAEAERLGEQIAKENPNATDLHYSTVKRGKDTAQIVADTFEKITGRKLTMHPMDALQTTDVGKADGKPEGTFDEHEWANNPDKSINGSETYNQFFEQIKKLREDGQKFTDKDVVLSHSKVMRMLEAMNESSDYDTIKKRYLELGDEEKAKTNVPRGTSEEKDGNLTGVSRRAMEELEAEHGVAIPESGTGWTGEEALKRGRQLLGEGVNPEKALTDFKANKTKLPLSDTVAVVRAHEENLHKAWDNAIDEHGEDSPEAKEAKAALEKWLEDIQPIATEASKSLTGYQGQSDVNTGSYTGLMRVFKNEKGVDPTSAQAKQLKELSEKYKDAQLTNDELVKKLDQAIQQAADEKEALEKKLAEAPKSKTKPTRITGKALIAEGVEDLAKALGVLKSFADERTPEVSKAVGKIARGLLDEGLATAENLWQKVKDYVKDKLDKDLPEHYEQDALEQIDKKTSEEIAAENLKKGNLAEAFADKKDNVFSPQEARAIWDYAKKTYVDKGASFTDTIAKTGLDLGLKPEQIRAAIASNKTTRNITDQIYLANKRRANIQQQAKKYIADANPTAVQQFSRPILKSLDFIRSVAVGGHGFVAPGTHASGFFFDPRFYKQFGEFIANTQKATWKPAEHAKIMADMDADPIHALALRSGLQVNSKIHVNDYSPEQNFLGKFQKAGNRGFDMLLPFRQEVFKKLYNNLPDSYKGDPNTAKEIASWVNHATGTTEINVPKWSQSVFFAPKLILSRAQNLVADPARATAILAKSAFSGDVSPAEKTMLKLTASSSAVRLATYASVLAINGALLGALGSKEKINYTDPTKPDFLKFKAPDGHTADLTGGHLTMSRYLAMLATTPIIPQKQLKGDSRITYFGKTLAKYGISSLSPGPGTAAELAMGHDFDQNVLPTSNDKPGKGRERISWAQYASEKLPIPAAEFAKQMREGGVDESTASKVTKGLIWTGLMTFTGLRVGSPEQYNAVKDLPSFKAMVARQQELQKKPGFKVADLNNDEQYQKLKKDYEADPELKKTLERQKQYQIRNLDDLLKAGKLTPKQYEKQKAILTNHH